IHTTQGYDLNYTGIIFGHEIRYNPETQQITVDAEHYHDRLGKQTIKCPEALKQYIINIYKTMMLRGIKGTFIYACDKNLRNYLKQHTPAFQATASKLALKQAPKLKPYINAVPYYDLKAAAGQFSALQEATQKDWVAVPS